MSFELQVWAGRAKCGGGETGRARLAAARPEQGTGLAGLPRGEEAAGLAKTSAAFGFPPKCKGCTGRWARSKGLEAEREAPGCAQAESLSHHEVVSHIVDVLAHKVGIHPHKVHLQAKAGRVSTGDRSQREPKHHGSGLAAAEKAREAPGERPHRESLANKLLLDGDSLGNELPDDRLVALVVEVAAEARGRRRIGSLRCQRRLQARVSAARNAQWAARDKQRAAREQLQTARGTRLYRRQAKSLWSPSSREMSSFEKVSPGIMPLFLSQ